MQRRDALEHQAEAAGGGQGAGQRAGEAAIKAQGGRDDESRRDKARQDQVFRQRRPRPAEAFGNVDGAPGQPEVDGEQQGLRGGDARGRAQQDHALDCVGLDVGIELFQIVDQFVEIGAETAQQRRERGVKTMVEVGQRGDADPGGDDGQSHHDRKQRPGAEELRRRRGVAFPGGKAFAGEGARDQRRRPEAEQEDESEQGR